MTGRRKKAHHAYFISIKSTPALLQTQNQNLALLTYQHKRKNGIQ